MFKEVRKPARLGARESRRDLKEEEELGPSLPVMQGPRLSYEWCGKPLEALSR